MTRRLCPVAAIIPTAGRVRGAVLSVVASHTRLGPAFAHAAWGRAVRRLMSEHFVDVLGIVAPGVRC